MNTQKTDRRIKITKQAIRESLLELMLQYPLPKISVKMICESADINRSTFYAHYKDQYDLLETIQSEVVEGIRQYILHKDFIIHHTKIATPVLIQILEYAKANQNLFKVLLNHNNGLGLQQEFMFLANEKTQEEITEANRLDEATTRYIGIFEIAGVISIMREWMNQGCTEAPEKLAGLISRLLFLGISGCYQGSVRE